MKKSPGLIITCRHNPRNVVRTAEGEYVCKCGVVLEEKIAEEGCIVSHSKMSLYHQIENGGDPKDMKVINKNIHIYSSRASGFSNICNKLGLPDFIGHRAWKIYRTFRKNTYHSRAKCATFSIYVACREGSWSVDESQIKDAVCSVLCVKKSPEMLSVLSEMNEDALNLGIDTNNGHSSNYYLNLAMSKKQHLFASRRGYERFTVRAMNNFAHLTEGDHQNRAQRAIGFALGEMV